MKKAIIIHGAEGSPTDHWYPKEAKELEKLGYRVLIPQMPDPFTPKRQEWIKALEGLNPDKDTTLIGFSLDGTTILGYLEECKHKVENAILIATPVMGIGHKQFSSFFVELDYKKIRGKAKKFVIICQDKDYLVPMENGHKIAEGLGISPIILEGDNLFFLRRLI